jgi:hypothetical protein
MPPAPMPTATSVEDAFRPAFQEIARRRANAGNAIRVGETAHFAREQGKAASRLPFALPGQEHVLVTMGTNVLAPRPLDATRPAFRVYGAFATREEALEHAPFVAQADPHCSLVLLPRNEWALLPQTEASRDDPEERARRLAKRLAAHRDARTEASAEFERAVRERAERPPPKADESEWVEEEDGTREAEAIVYPPPRRLRAGAEVRGQTHLAMCAIPDPLGGECLVKVLGCFESAADADAWIRDQGSRVITDEDIVVAPTCEWLYPNSSKDGARGPGAARYRNDELQRIMDAAARNPQVVRDYKEWKAEQDRLKAEEDRLKAEEEAAAEAGDDAPVPEGGDDAPASN